MGTLPVGTTLSLLESDYRHKWVNASLALTVDASAGTCLVNSETKMFTVTSGLTSPIPLAEGLKGVFGNPPNYLFKVSLDAVRQPSRDLHGLMSTLETLPIKWLDAYKPYRDSLNFNDRLAAYTLNHCESVYES